jgi:AraC family transcriptional regulator of adaptative response/methylated-DNA-[protein]-cysteine methyltransferase
MLEFQMKTLHKRFDAAIVPGTNEYIKQAQHELKEYFTGKLKKFTVKLNYPGTEFQQNVWSELQKISYGETISYYELAIRVTPGADRAGTANGMNRIELSYHATALSIRMVCLRLRRWSLAQEVAAGSGAKNM